MSRDLRQAWRSLMRRKGYFLACAATLTLVFGANAAVSAVASATLVRPLPFEARQPVVQLYAQPPGTTAALQRNPLQQMEIPRLRERTRTLARVEGFFLQDRVVTLGGAPTVARSAAVTPGLLELLRAPIASGRKFVASDAQPGAGVALVTYRYWQDVLGAANVLGTPLVIDGQPHAIVGVLSEAFMVPFVDAQVLTPMVLDAESRPRAPALTVVALAELQPDTSLDQAREELTTIYTQMGQEFPRSHLHWTIGLQSVRDWQFAGLRTPLLMLLGASALVLIIACVNIANLTAAQADGRSGELALRLALGASPRDIIRVVAAEGLIICVTGLIPGLLLASVAVPALLAVNPAMAATIGEVSIDWRVQVVNVVLMAAVVIVVSVWPATRALRRHNATLPVLTTSRTVGSQRTTPIQRALVSVEVALCVALLVVGGAVLQGLIDLARRSPGYDAGGVFTAQISLPGESYGTPARRTAVVDELLDRIRAMPGVVAAGITQNAFRPGFSYQTLIRVRDLPTTNDQPHTVQYRRVSADYFGTMRIPLLEGRAFSADDTPDRPPVAIISRRFADALMPGISPVGRQLVRNNPPLVTIVGVVDDARDVAVTAQPEPTLYVPWTQNSNFGVPVAFVVRTSIDPASLAPSVRDALRQVDPALPLRKVQPLETFVAESAAPERFRAFIVSSLAALGLVLSAGGIAGVTHRRVIDRLRDFAVRIALGSSHVSLVRLVVGETLRDVAVGAAAGLALGVPAVALLAAAIPHIPAANLGVTASVVVALTAAGTIAAVVPAARIRHVNPATLLQR